MADLLLDNQSAPTTPASGQAVLYFDSTSKLLSFRNDLGVPRSVNGPNNASVATQAYTTSEIYLNGSSLVIPSHLLQVGATFRWRIVLTKTAGTGVLLWRIRVGTAGAIGDTERVLFTQVSVPTSVTDTAFVDVTAVVRVAGASGILAAGLSLGHILQNTGFSLLPHNVQQVTSAAFDMTVANLIVGLTFNHQTAGAGNIEIVTAELDNG